MTAGDSGKSGHLGGGPWQATGRGANPENFLEDCSDLGVASHEDLGVKQALNPNGLIFYFWPDPLQLPVLHLGSSFPPDYKNAYLENLESKMTKEKKISDIFTT